MLIDKHKSADSAYPHAEQPPPYSLETASAQSTSRSRRLSVLPPLPIEAEQSESSSQLSRRANDSADLSRAEPNSFSQIRLSTHFTDLSGTFYIDPKSQHLTNKNKKKKHNIPDAIFHSRSGKIGLELATSGVAPAKATVVVASKSGNITLNLLAADNTKPRFDLEVQSHSGTVVIFIPNTYMGAIQLHTRSGSLEFLPVISKRMHVVKSADTESLVLFGQQTAPSNQTSSDFCHVKTRSGKIIVGVRGEDTYIEPPGLWQRIEGYLKGDGGRDDHASS
ncbi:hypothetical protein C8R43DRAFT_999707 [Mycena crocata]|nr:hypothetical protein C8R43DRAFT_999707 [Mycena crocata]